MAPQHLHPHAAATPAPSPSADANPVTDTIDTVNNAVGWLLAHPWITVPVIAWIAALYGWRQLRTWTLTTRGKTLPGLGDLTARTLRYLTLEDTRPLLRRPQPVARRTTWLTGRVATLTGVLTTAALTATGNTGPAVLTAAVTVVGAYRRTRDVFRYRYGVITTMFAVANAEFRYGKGAELNPRAWIQVPRWQDTYFPVQAIVNVPSGYQSEEPKNRERFETNFTGSVTEQHGWTYEWESAKGRVTAAPTPKLPATAAHPGPQPHKWDEFPLGITYGGKEAIWTTSTAPHVLVAGPTGSGKSVVQRSILLHALTHPRWRVIGLDPKKVELASLRDPNSPTGLKPQVLKVTTTLEDMTEALEQVEKEMHDRYAEMESLGVNHFLDLPDPPPALLVMVDEVFALLAPEGIKSDEGKERDALHARCASLLGSLARLGRASGVALCLATQRPDAKNGLSGETKNNLDARIACGRMDTTPSLMVLDSDRACSLPRIKGRGILRLGGEYLEYQGYFLAPDLFDEQVAAGRDMYAAMEANGGTLPQPEPVHSPAVGLWSRLRRHPSTAEPAVDLEQVLPDAVDLLGPADTVHSAPVPRLPDIDAEPAPTAPAPEPTDQARQEAAAGAVMLDVQAMMAAEAFVPLPGDGLLTETTEPGAAPPHAPNAEPVTGDPTGDRSPDPAADPGAGWLEAAVEVPDRVPPGPDPLFADEPVPAAAGRHADTEPVPAVPAPAPEPEPAGGSPTGGAASPPAEATPPVSPATTPDRHPEPTPRTGLPTRSPGLPTRPLPTRRPPAPRPR